MKFLNIGVREIAKQNCHLNKVYHPFVFYRHRPPNTNRQGTNSSEENTLLVLEGGGDTGGKISNDANSRVSFMLLVFLMPLFPNVKCNGSR
jgi:hypothetical protein